MELLCPTFLPIHFAEHNQHGRLEFQNFLLRQSSTAIYLVKDSLNFRSCIILGIEFFNSVVRQFTSLFREKIVTLTQGSNHIVKAGNSHIAHFGQLFYICAKIGRNFHRHCLIRTPSRQHPDFKAALTCLDMVFQGINRIICSTNHFHVITAHHATGGIFRLFQLLITFIINFTGRMRIENFIDSKSGLQFKVGPVIQRITESIRYRFGPLLKLFPICSILTGTETFVHTIGTHGTPLVVVTSQPNLSQ